MTNSMRTSNANRKNPLHYATMWYPESGSRRFHMDKKEFSQIRRCLGKTQSQMAQLVGTSLKAIQSFEQGWRSVPVHVERQVLFLLAKHTSRDGVGTPCWVIQQCPVETRRSCPAWEFQTGDLCWFINGTICRGVVQGWQKKMSLCRQCKVFEPILSSLS